MVVRCPTWDLGSDLGPSATVVRLEPLSRLSIFTSTFITCPTHSLSHSRYLKRIICVCFPPLPVGPFQNIIYIPDSSLKVFESTFTSPQMPSLLSSLSILDTAVNVLHLKYKSVSRLFCPKLYRAGRGPSLAAGPLPRVPQVLGSIPATVTKQSSSQFQGPSVQRKQSSWL